MPSMDARCLDSFLSSSSSKVARIVVVVLHEARHNVAEAIEVHTMISHPGVEIRE